MRRGATGTFHAESDSRSASRIPATHDRRRLRRQSLAPFCDAIDRHSERAADGHAGADQSPGQQPEHGAVLVPVGAVCGGVKGATWVDPSGQDEHPDGSDLLSAVFLTSFWKDNVRHWRFLDGYAHLVHGLFEALPPSSIVLDDYARFLYHIGERSLPDAFVRIAHALRRGDPQRDACRSRTRLHARSAAAPLCLRTATRTQA